MKTYSRQTRSCHQNGELPTKRRRVSVNDTKSSINTIETASLGVLTTTTLEGESSTPPAMPSTPTQPTALLSTDPPSGKVKLHTPPSSPPSFLTSIKIVKQNAFTLMRPASASNKISKSKPKPTRKPRTTLSESSGNAQAQPAKQAPKHKPRQQLTQLHLDLGQSFSRRCDTCGMSYVLTNAEDVALHNKFHAQNAGGVDLGKSFVESQRLRNNVVWEGTGGNKVVECSRGDGEELKRNVRCVLDLATEELGAVAIDDGTLWSQKTQKEEREADGSTAALVDRFKVFLYIRRSKCVALCVAERIDRAWRVLGSEDVAGEEAGALLTASEKKYPVVLGISRIWTSKEHRGKGLATLLLNLARENFLYGVEVRDEEVAFSQPTVSGSYLARKWFGSDAGWHVYDDT